MSAGVRPGAPTATVELADTEFDVLEKVLKWSKHIGMGSVDFNPQLVDPIRRKLKLAAREQLGLLQEDEAK